ncbi:MAG: DUF3108 domain-containing protein [Burkholderiales bacterium]|nr:DUF3108 domain-containing protein [Burkholderiales bacterium]
MRPPSQRLLAAAALSMAAHAAILGGIHIPAREPAVDLQPLSAQIEPLPPPRAEPAPRSAPARKPPPQRLAAAPTAVETAPAFSTEPAISIPAPEPVITPPVEPETAAPPEPAVVASASPTMFREPETPPLPDFPRKGRITYLLTMGPDQTPVGRTVQSWEFGEGRYMAGGQSESTGLVELFRPHRYHYLSQGAIVADRLRPERFLASIKRGSRSEETLAVFNWDENLLRLGRLPQQATVALPAGSQDWISFMFNLALTPPAAGRITLPFTRGSRLDTVSFDVLPAESIDTPLGRLLAVPVVQVRTAGQESMALWLASDYRNLPVRIRFFNREGELSGEQLVSEIKVGNP